MIIIYLINCSYIYIYLMSPRGGTSENVFLFAEMQNANRKRERESDINISPLRENSIF